MKGLSIGREARYALYLLPLPILILLSNPNISMSNAHGCDSWTYFGMYHRYGRMVRTAQQSPEGPAYMVSRLPAILPAYAVYQVVPTRYRRAVKFLVFFYAFMFALYLLLNTYMRKRSAFATTTIFCVTPIAAGLHSSDIMSGPTITYMTMAIMFTGRAAHSKRQTLMHLASGVFYAAAAHSQPTSLVFALTAPAVYLYARFRVLRLTRAFFMDALRALALNLLGIAALTVLMQMVFKYYFGGAGYFWTPQYDFLGAISSTRTVWLRGWREGLKILPIVPIFAFLIGYIVLRARYFLGPLSPLKREVLLLFSSLIVVQFALAMAGWYFLHFDVYNLYSYPVFCVFAGAFIVSRWAAYRKFFSIGLLGLVSIALLLLSVKTLAPRGWMHWFALGIVAALIITSLGLARFPGFMTFSRVLLLMLMLASIKPAYEFFEPWQITARGHLRNKFKVIEEMSSFVDRKVTRALPRFWAAADLSNESTATALVRSYWGCPKYKSAFTFPEAKGSRFASGDSVVILKTSDQNLKKARKNLNDYNLEFHQGERRFFVFKGVAFELVHGTIRSIAEGRE